MSDRVTLRGVRVSWEELSRYLLNRDRGCVARFVNNGLWSRRFPMLQGLPEPGPCRSASGERRDPRDQRNLTREHVKSVLGMSARATNDEEHVVLVCWGHHVFWRQWCTSKVVRAALRAYIALTNRLSTESSGLSTVPVEKW